MTCHWIVPWDSKRCNCLPPIFLQIWHHDFIVKLQVNTEGLCSAEYVNNAWQNCYPFSVVGSTVLEWTSSISILDTIIKPTKMFTHMWDVLALLGYIQGLPNHQLIHIGLSVVIHEIKDVALWNAIKHCSISQIKIGVPFFAVGSYPTSFPIYVFTYPIYCM